jgi:hypothetical protein
MFHIMFFFLKFNDRALKFNDSAWFHIQRDNTYFASSIYNKKEVNLSPLFHFLVNLIYIKKNGG